MFSYLQETGVEPDRRALRRGDTRPFTLRHVAALKRDFGAKVPHLDSGAGLAADLAIGHLASARGLDQQRGFDRGGSVM